MFQTCHSNPLSTKHCANEQWIYSDRKFIDVSYASLSFKGGAFARFGGPEGGAFANREI